MNSKLVAFIALFAILIGCVVSAQQTETIKFHLYEGSSNWWVGVDPQNDRYDTVKVEIRGASETHWTTMMYNPGWPYFHVSSASGSGFSFPLSFRLTAANGEQVVASVTRITSNVLVDTGIQYGGSSTPVTEAPTQPATEAPTEAPATQAPTQPATEAPTQSATEAPVTQAPTQVPTQAATEAPATQAPTQAATEAPVTQAPTQAATEAPTQAATEAPISRPSIAPTSRPSTAPTSRPPTAATSRPTERPTEAPTQAPTQKVTEKPTERPTQAPTQKVTEKPTEAPTQAPTQKVTEKPTQAPTQKVTEKPTEKPTVAPTQAPTQKATSAPTQAPTQPATTDLCSIVAVKSEPIKILVPLYVYPGAAWDTLIAAANNGAKIIAIINPNSGPNANGPDAAYTTYMRKFQAAGIEMIGYVHTLWGARPIATVNSEIGIWASKYPGVTGIFFDEASAESKDVSFYSQAWDTVLSKGFVHSVLNPGVQPDKQYLDISTNIVIFENYASELSRTKYDSWIKCSGSSSQKSGYQYKFSAIIHTAPQSDMPSLIAQAHNMGMGLIYVTDAPGGCCTYNYLNTYFAAQASSIKQLNSA